MVILVMVLGFMHWRRKESKDMCHVLFDLDIFRWMHFLFYGGHAFVESPFPASDIFFSFLRTGNTLYMLHCIVCGAFVLYHICTIRTHTHTPYKMVIWVGSYRKEAYTHTMEISGWRA